MLRQQQPDGGFEVIIAEGVPHDGTPVILSRLEEARRKREVRSQ